MDMYAASRSEKRKSFITAIALAMMVMLIAAPLAQAAVQQVKVKGKVGVKGNVTVKPQGGRFDSKSITQMGLTDPSGQVSGTSGALAVRNYAGGGGILGAGRCASAGPAEGTPVDIPGQNVITGIILTGQDGQVAISTEALPGGHANKVTRFRVTVDNPNLFVGLGNGLSTTAPLRFAGTAASGAGPGNCEFVILGQGSGMNVGG